MIDARTIALLVRAATTDIEDAAGLIERYAGMVASAAVGNAIREAGGRCCIAIAAGIDAPLCKPPAIIIASQDERASAQEMKS